MDWYNNFIRWVKSIIFRAKKRNTSRPVLSDSIQAELDQRREYLIRSLDTGVKKIVQRKRMIHHTFRSPNFSTRKLPIDSIILHHTGGKSPGCLWWLCEPDSQVSAHYLITQEGQMYELVDPKHRAWHAGQGAFDLNKDGKISDEEKRWNDRSIGIELEATEPYEYSDIQKTQLNWLVKFLCNKYKINPNAILGHKEIAPERKIDPANFNMGLFRSNMEAMLDVA